MTEHLPKSPQKPAKTPFERMTDLTRRVVRVPKSEIPKDTRKQPERKP